MIRREVFTGLVFSSVCILFAAVASADPPDTLRHYRFLPRQCVLIESGGFYPHTTEYRIRGTFDFATHWEYGDRSISHTATFENVDAWASHPILAFVLDLDRVLNLSGLKGRQLPVASIFEVYKFEGTTQDGSSVNLYASMMGRWLQLRGGTKPPSGGADMSVYSIKATARQTPYADFNEDDVVDHADLANWLSGAGDANGDELADGADLLAWQQQLGEAAPQDAAFDAAFAAAMASEAAAVAAVPEPGAMGLLLLSVAGFATRSFAVGRRRRLSKFGGRT